MTKTIDGREWEKQSDGSWTSGPWAITRAPAIATDGYNGWTVSGPWQGWGGGGRYSARSMKEGSWMVDSHEDGEQSPFRPGLVYP
jgi:hypothetical protein